MTTSWNLFTTWTGPLEASYFGEVDWLQSNMPGDSTYRADWNSMDMQESGNSSWYGTCNNITLYRQDDSSRWSLAAPSCDHIQVWT
jgi:hypothetical protein